MILSVFHEGGLQRLLWPEVWKADFPQAGRIPIQPPSRRWLARLHGTCNGDDVGRFGIDVERRRLVFHQRKNPLGIRRIPSSAAVAAAGVVLDQLSERHIT